MALTISPRRWGETTPKKGIFTNELLQGVQGQRFSVRALSGHEGSSSFQQVLNVGAYHPNRNDGRRV